MPVFVFTALQLPTECFVDGHLAAGFELLSSIHPDLGYLGQGSANSTFLPSRTKFFADAKERFEKWRRIHCLPALTMQSFETFRQQQWQLHERCVHAEYRLDWRKVQNCKKALQAFVVHCEDHHPNHLMAFCPQFYFPCVSRTWTDP